MLTNRHCRYHAPRVPCSASGPTNSSCKRSSGHFRACEIPESPATCTLPGPASHCTPSSTQRTSRAEYSAKATT